MSALVIGVDPGSTTGVCVLRPGQGVHPVAVQIHGSEGVAPYIRSVVECTPPEDTVLLAVEQFVVSARASRSSTPAGGRAARELIAALSDLAGELRDDYQITTVLRPAALVKPWATDHRLDAAGLLEPCKGMGHARDAARHALYAAVKAGLAPDPLSGAA